MSIAVVDNNFPVGADMDQFNVGYLPYGVVTGQTSSTYFVVLGDESVSLTGTGFTYTGGQPDGGTITGMQESYLGATVYTITGFSIGVTQFNAWAAAGDNPAVHSAIFGGHDVITGGLLADQLRAYDGDDVIEAGGGDATT
jgi:hypothetical protein